MFGFKLFDAGGSTQAKVDAVFQALRTTTRPMESLAWATFAERTGAYTAAAANTAMFSYRNIGANPVVVRRVGIGFLTTTAFTTAQEIAFGLKFARGFTASDSGGNIVTLTGNNGKHRTSLGTLTSGDCRISTIAALTAGTKALDTTNLGIASAWSGGQGQGLAASNSNLFAHDSGDYPMVLAQNEGFNIMNLIALGAVGVIVASVNIELAEVAAY